jgi:hypothetical protein
MPQPQPYPQQMPVAAKPKTSFLDIYSIIGSFAVAAINLYFFIRSPWWLNILMIVLSLAFGVYELIKIIRR